MHQMDFELVGKLLSVKYSRYLPVYRVVPKHLSVGYRRPLNHFLLSRKVCHSVFLDLNYTSSKLQLLLNVGLRMIRVECWYVFKSLLKIKLVLKILNTIFCLTRIKIKQATVEFID